MQIHQKRHHRFGERLRRAHQQERLALGVLTDGHRGSGEEDRTFELVALEGVRVGDASAQSRQVFRARIDQVDVRNESLV